MYIYMNMYIRRVYTMYVRTYVFKECIYMYIKYLCVHTLRMYTLYACLHSSCHSHSTSHSTYTMYARLYSSSHSQSTSHSTYTLLLASIVFILSIFLYAGADPNSTSTNSNLWFRFLAVVLQLFLCRCF